MKEHSHKEREAHDTKDIGKDAGPGDGKFPPEGVGESTTCRGEDVHREDGREFQELRGHAEPPGAVTNDEARDTMAGCAAKWASL